MASTSLILNNSACAGGSRAAKRSSPGLSPPLISRMYVVCPPISDADGVADTYHTGLLVDTAKRYGPAHAEIPRAGVRARA